MKLPNGQNKYWKRYNWRSIFSMSFSKEAILQQLMRKSNLFWVKAEIKRETFIVNNRARQSQEIIGFEYIVTQILCELLIYIGWLLTVIKCGNI